ncbi:uncharacterized protein METZ01_LOCUS209921, partial [marine metagenome]
VTVVKFAAAWQKNAILDSSSTIGRRTSARLQLF